MVGHKDSYVLEDVLQDYEVEDNVCYALYAGQAQQGYREYIPYAMAAGALTQGRSYY